MSRVPTPLTWKRRHFAVLEPMGMVDRLYALAVSGIVAGPFAIYPSPFGSGPFTLIHLPSQAKIIDQRLQESCRAAAEEFAALDLNWWTCDSSEIIGPDLQALRNTFTKWLPVSSVGTGKLA